MFWGKRKREEEARRESAAFREETSPHKGQILDQCANDVERRSLCLQWAGEARNRWYEGQRAYVLHVLRSKDLRYKHYSTEVRISIGQQQWGRSVEAKDLASLEQMYSRWAQSYAGGPGSER